MQKSVFLRHWRRRHKDQTLGRVLQKETQIDLFYQTSQRRSQQYLPVHSVLRSFRCYLPCRLRDGTTLTPIAPLWHLHRGQGGTGPCAESGCVKGLNSESCKVMLHCCLSEVLAFCRFSARYQVASKKAALILRNLQSIHLGFDCHRDLWDLASSQCLLIIVNDRLLQIP